MRWMLDRAPNFILALAIFAFVNAPCAQGQQAPAAAAQPGVAPGAAPTGKQVAKDTRPEPPPDPMVAQSAQLLRLAMELKAEIDKTNRNVLSIAVIRKAGEIERMAHGMKYKVNGGAAVSGGEEPGGSQK